MGRSMSPARPVAADRRIRERRPALDRPFRILLLFAALRALLPQSQGKDITNLTSITQKLVNKNTSKSNTSSLQNEIALEDDDDDFYLGYSSYLRSNSSMLASNFAQESSLPANNNDTNEAPKAGGHRRFKRAVTHLYNMILCATGCNPLAYKGYGCYCGFLGSGYPMDGIDRCCKMHDWCYDATDCPMFVEYFVPYYWKCYHGYKPICAIEHGEWGSSGSCAQRLCECDRSFAECLRRYRCPRHKAVCTSSPWRLIQNIFMII